MLVFSFPKLSVYSVSLKTDDNQIRQSKAVPFFAPFAIFFFLYFNSKYLILPHRLSLVQRSKFFVIEILKMRVALKKEFFFKLFFVHILLLPKNLRKSRIVSLHSYDSDVSIYSSRISLSQGVRNGIYTDEFEHRLRNSLFGSDLAVYWSQQMFPFKDSRRLHIDDFEIKTNLIFKQSSTVNLSSGALIQGIQLNDVSLPNGSYVTDSSRFFDFLPYRTSGFNTFPQRDVIRIEDKVFVQVTEPSFVFDSAVFMGSSSNWYHFLIEILPRGIFFQREFDIRVPVVLNANVPESIRQIATKLTNCSPILVGDGESVHIKNLYLLADSRYSHQADMHRISTDFNIFGNREDDIRDVSNWMIENFEPAGQRVSKMVFLARGRDAFRPLRNFDEVNEVLNGLGFATVYSGSLSISEQIDLFQKCEFLVAEGGAALTNLMFVNKKSKILRIESIDDAQHLGFWKQFSELLGLSMETLVGNPVLGVNKSFLGHTIDVYKLKSEVLRMKAL